MNPLLIIAAGFGIVFFGLKKFGTKNAEVLTDSKKRANISPEPDPKTEETENGPIENADTNIDDLADSGDVID